MNVLHAYKDALLCLAAVATFAAAALVVGLL